MAFSYVGVRPAQSLMQVQGGKQYYDELARRMAGQGVGYGDEYVSKTTAPRTAYSRSQFNSYTMPELQSQLSATGRRRGSAGFSQVAQALNEQAGKEGDIYAQEYGMNEQQKRNEINAALEGTGQFAESEAQLLDRLANFDYRTATDEASAGRQEKQDKIANRQRIIDNVLRGTSAGLSMIPTAGMSSGGSTSSPFSFWDSGSTKSLAYNPYQPKKQIQKFVY